MSADRLRRAALVVWTAVGVMALAWAVLVIADSVRVIWLPMAFAFGLVFLLSPLVKWLERRGLPRLVGSFLAFALFVAVIVAIALLVYPTVRDQMADFVQRLPDLYTGLVAWLVDVGDRFGLDVEGFFSQEALLQWLEDPANQETIQNLLFGFGAGAGFLIRGVTEAVVIIGLAPVLAIYMLIDLERFKANAVKLTPPAYQEEVVYVGGEVGTALGSFVRGQLLVALIVAAASSVGMWLIDLPFWLLVGLIAGFLNLIPFLGPVVGGALAFIVALLNGDPWQGVLAVLIFTGVQQVDNHVITPLIQRTRVNLSPFSIVVALVIGGSLAGLLGVLVAVPMTAAVRIIAGHLWRTRVLGQSWMEASEAMIEVTEPPERLARLTRRPQQTRLFDTQELTALNPETSDSSPGSGA
ncbi:MAG: AI-2E family transporter [Actinobacteria bacterium]|nr:AI-2E family transporter [Actinomycetota bacterium]MCI0544559.1 AI-2E family transporter [Actinomycetota bacterium]MCI0679373.1 AI-2E family transporter [Actinomycetota bacterium]